MELPPQELGYEFGRWTGIEESEVGDGKKAAGIVENCGFGQHAIKRKIARAFD